MEDPVEILGLVPDFGLAQPWLLWPLGSELMGGKYFSLSPFSSHRNKYILKYKCIWEQSDFEIHIFIIHIFHCFLILILILIFH